MVLYFQAYKQVKAFTTLLKNKNRRKKTIFFISTSNNKTKIFFP